MRGPGEEVERAVAAARGTGSFREIAAARGLTRGQVAGIIYRARHGIVRQGRPAPARRSDISPGQNRVLVLMADERERTTAEIAAACGYARSDAAWKALKDLERRGLLVHARVGRGGLPSIWRWAEDEL